jgi:hypothetical protein
VTHSKSGCGAEEKNSFHQQCQELKHGFAARILMSILTEYLRLTQFPISCKNTKYIELKHCDRVNIYTRKTRTTWCGYKVPGMILVPDLKGSMPVHVSTCVTYYSNALTPVVGKLCVFMSHCNNK